LKKLFADCSRRIALASCMDFSIRQIAIATLLGFAVLASRAADPSSPPSSGSASAAANANAPAWLLRPLSMEDATELALKQNANILKSKNDIEAAYGVAIQTRSIVFPKVRTTGSLTKNDPNLIETFPNTFGIVQPDNTWSVNLQLLQSLYEGGRMRSAVRSAKMTREEALAQFQVVVADTLLDVQVVYYDVLVAEELITVQEASVNLLTKELNDTKNRFEAGTVPQFNVLRAEVELANARPKLIRARNASRIAKNLLASQLGYDIPKDIWEDIPLRLSDKLSAPPLTIQLPLALAKALEQRPELTALSKNEGLRREQIVTAKAGFKPSVQAFGGYGSHNSSFSDDISQEVHGWSGGVQFSWDLFDGLLTKGRVQQADALLQRARVDIADTGRRIEREVRTAYSTFIEGQEVLESQKKVQEQAEEALRLAGARYDAGAGTQLDVLSAQTALTEARSTQVQALHDYVVARARLERAIGGNITISK